MEHKEHNAGQYDRLPAGRPDDGACPQVGETAHSYGVEGEFGLKAGAGMAHSVAQLPRHRQPMASAQLKWSAGNGPWPAV